MTLLISACKNTMISYLPWSKHVRDECLRIERDGGMPALDAEFSSQCTACNCIYCDSKPVVGNATDNELTCDEMAKVLEAGHAHGLKWLYSCGLGEPMQDPKFRPTINKAAALDIRATIFTNGMFIDSKATASCNAV